MTAINISTITGLTNPYTIYACNVFGNNCVLIANIQTSVPPTNIIVLPPQFNSAPIIGIKVITSNGCELFKTFICGGTLNKVFQDLEEFLFQDNENYEFQG